MLRMPSLRRRKKSNPRPQNRTYLSSTLLGRGRHHEAFWWRSGSRRRRRSGVKPRWRRWKRLRWCGARALASQASTRAASEARPGTIRSPARGWLTEAGRSYGRLRSAPPTRVPRSAQGAADRPRKARPDAETRTPRWSAERRGAFVRRRTLPKWMRRSALHPPLFANEGKPNKAQPARHDRRAAERWLDAGGRLINRIELNERVQRRSNQRAGDDEINGERFQAGEKLCHGC